MTLLPMLALLCGQEITLAEGKTTVHAALAKVSKAAKAKVVSDVDGDISLKLTKATYWQAVDAIAEAAKLRVVLPSRDGPVSLARPFGGESKPPTCYDGRFRLRVVRVGANRDLTATGGPSVTLGVEVAWAPGVRPWFLESRLYDAKAVADGKAFAFAEDNGGLADIAGGAYTVRDVVVNDVPRSATALETFEGRFVVVAPSKMLSFAFDADLGTMAKSPLGGALRKLPLEGVSCSIDKTTFEKDRWSVRVRMDYPEGGRAVESFQADRLVVNNELALRHRDGKRSLEPAGYSVDVAGTSRAIVTYHFRAKPGKSLGSPFDWRPTYRAPASVVDVPVRFKFAGVPLP